MTEPVTTLEPERIRLENLLARARRDQDQAAVLSCLLELGSAYLEHGETPKALTQFDEALKLAEGLNDSAAEARVHGLRGLGLRQIGNYTFSLQAFRKSHRLAEKIGHRLLVCDALTQIGMLQGELGDHLKAIATLERALGEAMQLDDPPRRMRIAGSLGNLFFNEEAYEKSLEYLSLSLETARRLGDRGASCAYLLGLGNSLLMADAEIEAIESYEEALQLANELGNRQAEVRSLTGLMDANARRGKYRLSLLYGDQAAQLAGEMQDAEVQLTLLHRQMEIAAQHDLFDQALGFLEKALTIAQIEAGPSWQVRLLRDQMGVLLRLDRPAEAQATCERALEISTALRNTPLQVEMLGQLCEIRAGLGDYRGGLAAAEAALAISLEDDPLLTGQAQMLMAFAHNDLGQYNLARDACRTAIAVFQKEGQEAMLANAEEFLAGIEPGPGS